MTIIVDENSYVDVVEADTYFSERFGYDLWDGQTEEIKEQLLISATQQLDLQCSWYGSKSDPDQDLDFPRIPDADPTPKAIKNAECEMAYAVLSTGSTSTDGGDALTELKAGSVTLKFDAGTTGNALVSESTAKMLSPYGLCSGSGGTSIIPMELQ